MNSQYHKFTANDILAELNVNGINEDDKIVPYATRRARRQQQELQSHDRTDAFKRTSPRFQQQHQPLVARTELFDELDQDADQEFYYETTSEDDADSIQDDTTPEVNNISSHSGKECSICAGYFGKHKVDECPARGEQFIPPHLLRRGNQYNLIHGKPSNEFDPKGPHKPPKGSYSSQPKPSNQQKTIYQHKKSSLQQPNVSMITADLPSHQFCTQEEADNIISIEKAMVEMFGGEHLATPEVVNVTGTRGTVGMTTPVVASLMDDKSPKGLIVASPEEPIVVSNQPEATAASECNIIPLGCDWASEFTSADYDAFGEALNC